MIFLQPSDIRVAREWLSLGGIGGYLGIASELAGRMLDGGPPEEAQHDLRDAFAEWVVRLDPSADRDPPCRHTLMLEEARRLLSVAPYPRQ
jgi:hypothetical protein